MNDSDHAWHHSNEAKAINGNAAQEDRRGVKETSIGSLSGKEVADRDPRYVQSGYTYHASHITDGKGGSQMVYHDYPLLW
jgi:hypothetical protein